MNRIVTTAAALLAAGLSAASPAQDSERRFAVGRFSAIELNGADSVRVRPGAGFSVTASGDPEAVALLEIAVRGDTLRIDRRRGDGRSRGAIVTVTMPTLGAATVNGSGAIAATDVRAAAFSGSVAGSGSLRVSGLRARAVRLDLSGSGAIVADGNADTVAIDAGGSGSVDTRALATPTLSVEQGGSGSVAAAASRSAAVRAGGSGSVRVMGGARCDVRRSGSGSVRCG